MAKKEVSCCLLVQWISHAVKVTPRPKVLCLESTLFYLSLLPSLWSCPVKLKSTQSEVGHGD